MKARYSRTIKSIAAISILVSALIPLSAAPASAEKVMRFSNPQQISTNPDDYSAQDRLKFRIRLDEKGDLMIQCGCARLVVAYNSPTDLLKPGEQLRAPQRDEPSTINGISFTASLSF